MREDIIEEMRLAFDERRKYMMSRLDAMGVKYIKPDGAFYLFVDITPFIGKSVNGKTITGSMDFASLLTESGVAAIPGLPFHADNYMRFSYAVSMSDIEEGFNRLEKFISMIV